VLLLRGGRDREGADRDRKGEVRGMEEGNGREAKERVCWICL